MGDTKAKFTDTRTGFIDILMCRYEDERLALWMKIVFCFIWIVSIPNGLIYGVDTDYIMALFSIILMLLLNIAVSRKNYRTWVYYNCHPGILCILPCVYRIFQRIFSTVFFIGGGIYTWNT